MKKSIILFAIILFALDTFSQNTFPSTGNVGIGTTSPSRLLDVRGDIYTNSNVYIDGGDLILYRTNNSFGYVSRPNISGYKNLGFCVSGGGALDAISLNALNSTFNGNVAIYGTCTIDVGDLYLSRTSNAYGYITRPNTTGYKKLALTVAGGGPLENFYVNSSMSQFNGNVGIGTSSTGSFKLAVEGKIGCRELKVTLATPWPDYVFHKRYQLLPLSDLEKYIQQNGHLPNIPSANEIEKSNGVELGDMSVKLLEKIEELTLYVIELKKENEEIRQQLKEFSKKN